eukprot:NODE_3024_length_2105_cov_7.401416.p1 GENE.NODE_3024_length_2105_cov_7.401416~~NODE_3024_length_2105_cov_7.401416.p1  ORF type:complete len:560 (+),score=157.56 NODE_3024_length_2105_cov_7.401416:85-1764(+)
MWRGESVKVSGAASSVRLQRQPAAGDADADEAEQQLWWLLFRVDHRASRYGASSGTVWEHQRDFFIRLVDPPMQSGSGDGAGARGGEDGPFSSMVPYIASDLACQIANLAIGRPFREQLPGHSYDGRSVVAIGKDCLAAGLAAAMLGARVAVAVEHDLLHCARQNVRLFLQGTPEVTSTKGGRVVRLFSSAVPPSAASICKLLDVNTIDVVLLTESRVAPVMRATPPSSQESSSGSSTAARHSPHSGWAADTGEFVSFRLPNRPPNVLDLLAELAPRSADTKVLIVCDGKAALPNATCCQSVQPPLSEGEGGGLPFCLDASTDWCARPFCTVLDRFPVVWVERADAANRRSLGGGEAKPSKSLSKAPSSVRLSRSPSSPGLSTCTSNPQRIFLDRRLRGAEWSAGRTKLRDSRLKESFMLHNCWKQNEAVTALEEAREWAQHRLEPEFWLVRRSSWNSTPAHTLSFEPTSPNTIGAGFGGELFANRTLCARERMALAMTTYVPLEHRKRSRGPPPRLPVIAPEGNSPQKARAPAPVPPIVERHWHPNALYHCKVYGPDG